MTENSKALNEARALCEKFLDVLFALPTLEQVSHPPAPGESPMVSVERWIVDHCDDAMQVYREHPEPWFNRWDKNDLMALAHFYLLRAQLRE
jgi:hypothetical protein